MRRNPLSRAAWASPCSPPGSYYLKAERIREPEKYTMSQTVPGRINSIVNIHNPSIEFYPVDRGLNTGVIVILAAGGGHNTLTVGSEAADFLPFFYDYGVNTVIVLDQRPGIRRPPLRRPASAGRTLLVRDARYPGRPARTAIG